MRQLTIFLRKKILNNPEDRFWEACLDVLLLVGFVLTCFVVDLILCIIISTILNGDAVIDVNNTSDILITLASFSLPSLLCYAIIPILIFHSAKKWKIGDFGLRLNNMRPRNTIIRIICLVTAIICLIRMIFKYDPDLSIRIFLVFLFVGINEEILVRGILYKLLTERFSKWAAVIIASFIFVFVLHSGGEFTDNLLFRFPLSIFLFLLYLFTGDIFSSILVHFAYNVFVSSL